MATTPKTFILTAEEKEPNSFEYVSGRHHLLMSKTMKTQEVPTTWFSPVDLMLSGIAGCLGLTFRSLMEKAEFTYENLRIEVTGIRPEGAIHSGIYNFSTKIFVKTDADPEKVKEIVERSEKSCTVRNTIDHPPVFETEVIQE
jgi:uncharacterized OsmC-like protein